MSSTSPQSSHIHDFTVAQLASKLRAKELSALEVTQHFLTRSHAADLSRLESGSNPIPLSFIDMSNISFDLEKLIFI